MTQSRRKLLGALLLVLLLIVYPLSVAIALGGWLATLVWWQSVAILAVLGLLWFVPAAVVIRWMARPD